MPPCHCRRRPAFFLILHDDNGIIAGARWRDRQMRLTVKAFKLANTSRLALSIFRDF